jgi:hypothetical protein
MESGGTSRFLKALPYIELSGRRGNLKRRAAGALSGLLSAYRTSRTTTKNTEDTQGGTEGGAGAACSVAAP